MLQAIGVGTLLEGQGCAIRRIEVRDGLSPEALKFDSGAGDDALGIMFENRALRRALRERALAADKHHASHLNHTLRGRS